jgi:hypothetical protein
MPDDVAVKPSTDPGAVAVRADDVGGKLYQVVKLAFGADGSAILVEASSGLPVQLDAASLAALETINIGNFPPSQVVTGPLTDVQLRAAAVPVSLSGVALEATLQAVLAELRDDRQIQETIWTDSSGAIYLRRTTVEQDTGSVAVTYTDAAGAAATPGSGLRPVERDFDREIIAERYVVTSPALGYSVNDVLIRYDVRDINTGTPSSLGVFWYNATTQAQLGTDPSGDVALIPNGTATAALQSAGNTSLATLAGVVRLEDSPSADGDPGVVMLMQRRDTDASAVSGDGDYATLKGDEEGRLKVSTKPASFDLVSGTITGNGQTVFADVRRASNVMFMMNTGALAGHNVSFEGSIDSTNGTDGVWFAIQAVRSNANTIETSTGALAATPAYAWECSVNGLAYVRVRTTAHTSGSATWKVQRGVYATEPIPAAQISGTQPVSGTVTANIGTGSIAAGTNAIGDVGLQARANATGAASTRHVVSTASTNAVNVKGAAGRVLGWAFVNTTASWRYVKLHNIATTPTAGTGVVQTIGVPPNGLAQVSLGQGIAFTTGIGLTVVTGAADADATATAANDVVGDLFFA